MDIKSKFSDKVRHLEGSAIREMFKLMAKPGIISFAGGAPDPALFPNEEFAAISEEVLRTNGPLALSYGITEGYAPLRQWVVERLKKQGIISDSDDTIIVSGGQQGIDLATKSLINAGDGVICEEPTFIGGLNCFRSYNADIYGVDVDSDGLNTDMLEEILKANNNIKVLYTIATFQNPSGITMSLEKRKKVLELAEKYDIIIFEDNPYGELRFSGEPVPTLKSLDKNGRVVYFGSFSKILSPGLRVGFVSCAPELMARMVICKQVQDVHTPVVTQMIVHEFVTRYSVDEHIAKISKVYGDKCNYMMELMDKLFPKCVEHTRPEGGLFLFCTMPDGIDSKELLKDAIDKNVAFVPGATTMIDDKKTYSSFRMNYSQASFEQIEQGVKILAYVLNSAVK